MTAATIESTTRPKRTAADNYRRATQPVPPTPGCVARLCRLELNRMAAMPCALDTIDRAAFCAKWAPDLVGG